MAAEPIILASKSASRRAMLNAAGVVYEAIPAEIDERAVERALDGATPAEIAMALSAAKAEAVSKGNPRRLVLGSDSLVEIAGRRFDKPGTREQASEHLAFFSGKAMQLHSGAALFRGGSEVWGTSALAQLNVRELSEPFIESYLDGEWPEVGHCVGVFRIEGRGAQLFESIEGDMFTVLGMPLLQVLAALREQGVLQP